MIKDENEYDDFYYEYLIWMMMVYVYLDYVFYCFNILFVGYEEGININVVRCCGFGCCFGFLFFRGGCGGVWFVIYFIFFCCVGELKNNVL